MSDLPFPLVQANWKKAMTFEGEQSFGHNFYKNLFTDHPSLKDTLFGTASIEAQKVNLPKSITAVLGLLTDMPKAVGALQALGQRHVYYGTPNAGYAVVGANLIKTLAQILGDEFTEEHKKEWIALYAVIEKTMIDSTEMDSAIPHWRRFAKRRATEFKTSILTPAEGKLGKFAESVSLTAKANFSLVLQNVDYVDEAITKQSTAPIRAAGARLAKEGKVKSQDFANLSTAIANNICGKSTNATPYEKMVIDWFVSHLQAGFEGKLFDESPLGKSEAAAAGKNNSSSSSSCCGVGMNSCTAVCVASVVAAVGVAAWFLLKKN